MENAAAFVRTADWERDGEMIRAVRFDVFCREQGIARELDSDGLDGACGHVLALAPGGEPVGTGRGSAPALLRRWRRAHSRMVRPPSTSTLRKPPFTSTRSWGSRPWGSVSWTPGCRTYGWSGASGLDRVEADLEADQQHVSPESVQRRGYPVHYCGVQQAAWPVYRGAGRALWHSDPCAVLLLAVEPPI